MPTTTTRRITVDEYLRQTVEGDHKQLIDGEVVVNLPRFRHQRILGTLYMALCGWSEAVPGRGVPSLPIDVQLGQYDYYGPDLVWFSEARRPRDPKREPDHLPDLCVEIRSPGTWRYDIGAKKRRYETSGLPELWLVDDVAETVLAYRRSTPTAPTFDVSLEPTSTERLTAPMLPGFAITVGELFPRE